MAASRALLELIAVSKRYDSVESAEHLQIIKDVTLQIGSGESVAIVGPSGSGKSTLLNIIGTLDRPTSGEVFLDGSDLAKLDEKQLAQVRNRQIGFVFQAHHLLPQCTVLENVLVPTLADSNPQGDAEQRARALIRRVGLGDRMEHRPGQLSGGERQRAAVVRALIMKPKLLLADEPTGSLDRSSSYDLTQLLIELNREEGVTLIVVTHAPDLAKKMGRVMEIREGTLVQQ